MRRLVRHLAIEAALGVGVIGVTALVLGVIVPAAHVLWLFRPRDAGAGDRARPS